MKLIPIDDDAEYAVTLFEAIFTGEVDRSLSDAIEEAADVSTLADIISKTVDDGSVLLINVNLIVGGEARQSHQGTELLTWLRIKGVMNYCLLYSFQSLESLVRSNRKNLLLLSKGASFLHLPNDIAKATSFRTADIAEPVNLKAILKAIFNVGQFRHRDANWWSVKVLWDLHKVVSEGQFTRDYPKHVRDQLSILNNAVGVYLHGLEASDVNKFIRGKKDQLAELRARLAGLTIEVVNADSVIQGEGEIWRQVHREALTVVGGKQEAQPYLHDVSCEEAPPGGETVKAEQAATKTEVDKPERACEEDEVELRRVISEIAEIQHLLSSFDFSVRTELFGSETPPKPRKSKILLIDDNANNGWKDIFEAILDADVLAAVPPKAYKHDIGGLYDHLQDSLEEIERCESPSLIFLDLRLYNERGRSIDLEQVSGKMLLSKIRSKFRGVPIVIITASNKVWSFQKLVELGADAYWVKEGLDELRTVEDSVRNYARLLFLVDRMTDGRYQFLKELSSYAKLFEKKEEHWFNRVTWLNGETTAGDVKAIAKALNDSFYVTKNYLHNYHLKYGCGDARNESFILSGLINKLAGVYESVHDAAEGETGGKLRDERGDYRHNSIRKIRNKSSHRTWTDADWPKLDECFRETKKYLDTPFVLTPVTTTSAKSGGGKLTIEFDDTSSYEFEYALDDIDDYTNLLDGVILEKLQTGAGIQDFVLSKPSLDKIGSIFKGLIANSLEVKFDGATSYNDVTAELNIRVNNDFVNKFVSLLVKANDLLVKNLEALKANEVVFTLRRDRNGNYMWDDKRAKVEAAAELQLKKEYMD